MKHKVLLKFSCGIFSVLCLIVFFTHNYSQTGITNCYYAGTCSAYCAGGGSMPCTCDLRVGYGDCDGNQRSFRKTCTEYSQYIDQCECSCSSSSNGFEGGIAYRVIRADRYVVETYACANDCPTPTATPTPPPPSPGGGGGDECPCGNCETGCNDPDPEPNCGWQTIPGSCWMVSTEWTDPYTGITYGEETIECDPDQEVYVCE